MHNFFRPGRNGNSARSEVAHRPMAAEINRCRLVQWVLWEVFGNGWCLLETERIKPSGISSLWRNGERGNTVSTWLNTDVVSSDRWESFFLWIELLCTFHLENDWLTVSYPLANLPEGYCRHGRCRPSFSPSDPRVISRVVQQHTAGVI